MHQHPAIILESEKFLVEQGVDVRREQDAVIAINALSVAGFPPWLDVTGDQHSRIGTTGDAAGIIQQDHALSEQTLADSRLRQLQTLGNCEGIILFDVVNVFEYIRTDPCVDLRVRWHIVCNAIGV